MNLGEFLSHEAGQKRRAWLDSLFAPIENAQGFDRIATIGDMLNPVSDIGRAGVSARTVFDPNATTNERIGATGAMLTDMASVLAPGVATDLAARAGGKTSGDAVRAITEALAGFSAPADDAVTRFAGGDAGSVRLGGGNEDAMRRYIASLDEVTSPANSGDSVFVRWSAGPEFDMKPAARSRDYQTGDVHEGLSAVQIDSGATLYDVLRSARDYSYLRGGGYKNNAPHVYIGEKVGVDSDGAPSIIPRKYIGTFGDNFIKAIDDPTALERLSLERSIENGRAGVGMPVANGRLPFWTQERLDEYIRRLDELGGKFPNPFDSE